jgi:FkbM family methyltransferase
MVQKLKSLIQLLIQNLLGYPTYLYIFSIYRVYRFKILRDDIDFIFFLSLTKSIHPSTIIDAGANVGYTSVIFAKEYPSYNIIAYEPVSLLSNIILRVVKYFNVLNIKVNQLALGNTNSVVNIKTPIIAGVKKQGLSFIDVDVERGDESQINDFLEEEVRMVTIDSNLLDKNILPVVGIKVDVENFEFFVLKGSVELIKKFKPIVMAELWDNNRKNACIQLMEEIGYEVKVVENKRLVEYSNQQTLNYFFIPKSK